MRILDMEQPRIAKARLSSVANSIRLLTSFSGEEDELGITTLAGRLRLAKSTVHRLAATLTAAGFLEQNGDTGKYRLGMALFELGALVRRRMDVANEGRPKLRELLEKTGETVQMGVVDHLSVLYVYEMESPRAIRMAAAVGGRAPLHCTAVGKVLLAYQPEDFVNRVLETGLTAYTPKTLTRREAVLAMLTEVRAREHAIDDEESESGLRAIAAPVRNHNGAVIAAVGVAAPVQRMNKKVMQTCVPTVIATAHAVSGRLGYLPTRARASA
jgi:DNA-binding IclR family transcriptional regulator